MKLSEREGVDVEYLFLQVFVDRALVTDRQNCGNILAGVGPFAIERGLVAACDRETPVTIYMENTGQIAVARVATPGGTVSYAGTARIDGVPGTSAALPIAFPRHRRIELRGSASDRVRGRPDRRHRGYADRQRHALRGAAGVRHGRGPATKAPRRWRRTEDCVTGSRPFACRLGR